MESPEIRTPSLGTPDRTLAISGLAVGVAVLAALAAQFLTRLIGFITNLAFYSRLSTSFTSPADNHLGLGVILVPVIGALIVGLMARFGSEAIRGHGIPEAMEQVLLNESRIPARITFLKPVSAAIAIGTGGPFGAEGPIIATGGALGSLMDRSATRPPSSAKRCSPPARPPVWPRHSAPRSPPSCSPSSSCCSSTARDR
jgi:H+/Cl- antiporter ClcA